jgi:hypothetical protein
MAIVKVRARKKAIAMVTRVAIEGEDNGEGRKIDGKGNKESIGKQG